MDERVGTSMRRAMVFVGLGLVLAAPSAGWAAGTRIRQDLVATGVDPDARGDLKVNIRQRASGLDGKLQVNVRRLDRDATFEIVVDGVRIGTLVTNGGGNGRTRFRTTPTSSRDQLLGTDPRGTHVEVHDENGDDVLEADVDDDQDPSHVRCCVADDHGDEGEVECESESAAECAARGGVDLGPGSCLPNPCAASPGGEEVRCCIPEDGDDGPECEDRTAAECAEHHGINLGPGVCEPNPCGATPPPDEVRCCLPHDGGGGGDDDAAEGPECEHESALECAARGGLDLGPGACDPNPCVASPSGAFVDDLAR